MEQEEMYPILSKDKVARLVRRLELIKGVKTDSIEVNQGNLALNIGLDSLGEVCPFDNVGCDSLLEEVGFIFNPNPILDKKYGHTIKYYLFNWKRTIWTALGDNSYGNNRTRISVHWGEKLDPKTRDAVKSYMRR